MKLDQPVLPSTGCRDIKVKLLLNSKILEWLKYVEIGMPFLEHNEIYFTKDFLLRQEQIIFPYL